MKNFISILFAMACLFIAPHIFAQQMFDFRISSIQYDGEERPCIAVRLDPDTKEVKKAWEDFVKKQYKIRLKGLGFLVNKDVLSAEKVTVKALSDKAIDFRTRIVEEENHSLMQVFVSLGYDIYLNPDQYPAAFQDLKNTTWKFVKTYLPAYYKEQISEVAKELKDLNKEQKNITNDIADNKKEIEKLQKENEKLAKDLNSLDKDIQDKRQELNKKEAAKRAFEKEVIAKNQ
jgi:uncharacterized coiled-coil DUF342 family protein